MTRPRVVQFESATTVRVRGGSTSVSDGPVADSDEQLGGYSVFESNDLDEAARIVRLWSSAFVGALAP